MEKILRTCAGHEAAEEFDRQDALLQSMTERFTAFMTMMAPHYASAGRLQRIYRVDDFPARKICDDWGDAYNLYRNPRATGDIDFFLANTSDNEERIRTVLKDFGFAEVVPEAGKKLLADDAVIMLGRSPFRIDLLTTIDGVTLEEVERDCHVFNLDGLKIPVISAELLLANKLASGRPRDLADAAELKKIEGLS